MLVLTQNQAKAKADTLHKFLTERGVTLPKSDMLNAVARMAGFEDWNAMAAQYRPDAVDAQFNADQVKRIYDGLETSIEGYGPECVVQVASGLWLAAPPFDPEQGLDYVRVCDQLGRELVYWSIDEFTENAGDVLGALVGILNQSRTDRMPNPGNPVADKLVVADRSGKNKPALPRSNLSELPWSEILQLSICPTGGTERDAQVYFLPNPKEIDVDVLKLIDAERNGQLDADGLEELECLDDQTVIDWGEEYNPEGLTVSELRNAVVGPDRAWTLTDGRVVRFYRLQTV